MLAGVASERFGKQSNFQMNSVKVRRRNREQAVFDDDHAPVTIVGYGFLHKVVDLHIFWSFLKRS